MFPAPAAPWDVGRMLSWDGRPWSCFGYPKQHHIKLQSFLSAFQILLGTVLRGWRRFFCGASQITSLDAVYGVVFGVVTSVGGVGTGSGISMGWWHLPVLCSQRGAPELRVALKLLTGVSSEVGASLHSPGSAGSLSSLQLPPWVG